ncbi:MAG: hypothetical protein LBH36_02305 [Candidatus Nomurabacteria bacterium]|jgi:hypothetical protein|nr:hypothetical protein [Candidatus Nomurabacteria bacterium]
MDDNPNQIPNAGAQPPQDQPVVEAAPITEPQPYAAPEAPEPAPVVVAPEPVSATEPAIATEIQQPMATEPTTAMPEASTLTEPQPTASVDPMATTPAETGFFQPTPVASTAPEQMPQLQPAPAVGKPNMAPNYSLPGNKPKTGRIIGIVVAVLVIIGAAVAAIFIIPILGTKTLSCSMSYDTTNNNRTMTTQIESNAKFRGDTLQSDEMRISYIFDSESDAKTIFEQAETLKLKENIEILVNLTGTEYDFSELKLDGKKITVSAKASSDYINKLSNKDKGIEFYKKDMEDSGYTCKI